MYEEREGCNQYIGLDGKVVDSSWSGTEILPLAEGTK